MLWRMTEQRTFEGRVVVGFDGSDSSMRAAQWAAREARIRGRGLTLAHAILPPVTTGGLGVGLPPSLELIDELERQADEQLRSVASGFGEFDVVPRSWWAHPVGSSSRPPRRPSWW